MSLVEFKNYIKNQAQNLLKIEILKEEKQKLENELSNLSENKYSDKASNFIRKEIGHLQHDKGYKHSRAVAAAINVAKDKGYKIPTPTNEIDKSAMSAAKKDIQDSGEKFEPLGKSDFEVDVNKKNLYKAMNPTKINEALSEKGIATVQKQVAELGARETAMKIIDHIISKNLMGMTASDLPDSMTYANGLDEMESLLENGEYNEAFQLGKETAQEMISEEGGEGLF